MSDRNFWGHYLTSWCQPDTLSTSCGCRVDQGRRAGQSWLRSPWEFNYLPPSFFFFNSLHSSALELGCRGRIRHCLRAYFLPPSTHLRQLQFPGYRAATFSCLCSTNRRLLLYGWLFTAPTSNCRFSMPRLNELGSWFFSPVFILPSISLICLFYAGVCSIFVNILLWIGLYGFGALDLNIKLMLWQYKIFLCHFLLFYQYRISFLIKWLYLSSLSKKKF